ncbi:TPA: hypothetical protein ACGCGJ_000420 [Stenotrophomonas maltophilia]
MLPDIQWRPLDPNEPGAMRGLRPVGGNPDWVLREINEISVEIGALKGALIDAGILTSEQLNAALVRQRAIADSANGPAEEPSLRLQQPPAPDENRSAPRNE